MTEVRTNALLNGALHFCVGLVVSVAVATLHYVGLVWLAGGVVTLALESFASDARLERMKGVWFADLVGGWRALRQK